jgi:hypothetical protein
LQTNGAILSGIDANRFYAGSDVMMRSAMIYDHVL